MESSSTLNAHEKSPATIKEVYKAFQKHDRAAIERHPYLLDLGGIRGSIDSRLNHSNSLQLPPDLRQVFRQFLETTGQNIEHQPARVIDAPTIFECASVPGLFIYPSLLPPGVQLHLLDKLLHRDLSNSEHKTNCHMHYDISYPKSRDGDRHPSFFDAKSANSIFQPKDPNVHKPIITEQFLNKKLRWMTLGGQYDWTAKVYPSTAPPLFPPDTKQLLERLFPMNAEAAIVNLYSPGDTLSLHRDVSEECGAPLVSISLGCDGIFVVGLDEARTVVLRLRSGDAVLMSGEARYAWHGVPKVLEGTCPEWMEDWPAQSADYGRFEQWKSWMKGKRVNLNVRQMFA